jgi:Flp pilus assembly pilin Flp
MSALLSHCCRAILHRLGDTRRGATAVEYGLLLALIVGVCMSVLYLFSGATQGLYATFTYIAGALH